jgi:hypothetical protein
LNVTLLGTHPDSAKIQNVFDFFEKFDTNAMTESDYDTIKNNYNSLLQINDINTDMLKDLQTSMDESKELIDKATEAIDFATTTNDAQVIYNNLSTMLYDFNLASEHKQVEQLIVDYLTAMDKVDLTNGNTDTDRDILATDARTTIHELNLLLSKPDDYIASYLSGDITKDHAELTDINNKLMRDLIEKVVTIFTKQPQQVKIKVVKAPPPTIKAPPKTIYPSQVEFNKKMHESITQNLMSRTAKTGNVYKNVYITKHPRVNKTEKYSSDWAQYNGLDIRDPVQKKLKENYFDKI